MLDQQTAPAGAERDAAPTSADPAAPGMPAVPPPAFARRIAGWIEPLLIAAVCLYAAWFVLCYALIAWEGVPYPFHLDWIEGEMLDTVVLLQQGKNIYGPPTLDFVPAIYVPLFYVAVMVPAAVLGVDFLAARLVSLTCAIGLAVLLGRWVSKETGSRVSAWITGALWFSTYDVSGQWFHVARVDSMTLFLVFAGFYLLRFGRAWWNGLLVGLVLAAACMTKQTVMIVCVPVVIAAMVVSWRAPRDGSTLGWNGGRARTILALLSFFAVTTATVLVLQDWTDGWFAWWTFVLPKLHGAFPVHDWHVAWREEIWMVAGYFALGFAGLAASLWRNARGGAFLFAILFFMTGASFASRMHIGSHTNSWMPMHAILVLLSGLLLGHVQKGIAIDERRRFGISASHVGILLMLGFQMLRLTYDPQRCVPQPGSRDLGEHFVAEVAAMDGEVLFTGQRWVQKRAGKHANGLGMGAYDVFRIHPESHPVRLQLIAELQEDLASHRYSAVICNSPPAFRPAGAPPNWFDELLGRYYRFDRPIASPPPVVGFISQPAQVWVPREPEAGGGNDRRPDAAAGENDGRKNGEESTPDSPTTPRNERRADGEADPGKDGRDGSSESTSRAARPRADRANDPTSGGGDQPAADAPRGRSRAAATPRRSSLLRTILRAAAATSLPPTHRPSRRPGRAADDPAPIEPPANDPPSGGGDQPPPDAPAEAPTEPGSGDPAPIEPPANDPPSGGGDQPAADAPAEAPTEPGSDDPAPIEPPANDLPSGGGDQPPADAPAEAPTEPGSGDPAPSRPDRN
jgi:hypothetical protein